MMKKSTLKLALRRETLRLLAEIDLGRIVGGGNPDAEMMDTEGPNTTCVVQAAAQAADP
jgi:hypothetical protein